MEVSFADARIGWAQPVRLRRVRDTCSAYAFIRNEIFRSRDRGGRYYKCNLRRILTDGRASRVDTSTRHGIEKTRRVSVIPNRGA